MPRRQTELGQILNRHVLVRWWCFDWWWCLKDVDVMSYGMQMFELNCRLCTRNLTHSLTHLLTWLSFLLPSSRSVSRFLIFMLAKFTQTLAYVITRSALCIYESHATDKVDIWVFAFAHICWSMPSLIPQRLFATSKIQMIAMGPHVPARPGTQEGSSGTGMCIAANVLVRMGGFTH